MSAARSRLGCRGLRVTAGGRELLAVDALDVAAGETLAVLGPNGAGKSTLLRALGMLGGQQRRAGTVLLDGAPAQAAAMRAAVAAVLQRPILRRGSVADNVASGLRLRGVDRAGARRRAAPWLDALGIAHLADRDARTLSGGEAQRASIARALAVGPRVLLLDEPFAGLDATTRSDLLADLCGVLDGLGAATVLVTHDAHEAHALAHRTALLVAGRVRQVGPTAAVLDRPTDADCARLLGHTVLPVHAGGVPLAARPEHCLPWPGPAPVPPGGVAIAGTLRRSVPIGGAVRLDVACRGELVACLRTDPPSVPVGAPVTVTVAAEHLRRLDGDRTSPSSPASTSSSTSSSTSACTSASGSGESADGPPSSATYLT